MSDKVYLGASLADLDVGEKSTRISRVTLIMDNDNSYTAGDDTGRTIKKTVPWASQKMADTILSRVQGIEYQPFSGNDALIDPCAEIGDGITVCGIYSVLAQKSTNYGKMSVSTIAAPESDEIEDEYPYISKTERIGNIKDSQMRSSITKTAEEIRLEVTAVDGRVTTVSQTADKINWLVKSGTSSSNFTLTDRAIKLVSDTIDLTGFVTFTNLSSPGQTTIDGGNIKANTISADKISVTDLSVLGATIGGWTIASEGIRYVTADNLGQVQIRPISSPLSNGVFYVGTRERTSDGWTYPVRINGDGSASFTKVTVTGTVNSNSSSSLAGTLNSVGGSLGSVSGTFTGTHSGGTLSNTFGSFYGGHYSGVVNNCNLGGTSLATDSSGSSYIGPTSTYTVQVRGSNNASIVGSSASMIIGSFVRVYGALSADSLTVSGEKTRIIETKDYGTRCLDAYETPSPTFADYGIGTLNEDGICYIVIDPIFSETVNPDYMPTVFLTKYGKDGDIWVENITRDSVLVCGTPGLKFAWETRYQQANIAQGRLRNFGFANMETFRTGYADDAAVWIEHNTLDYKRLALESLDEATQPNIDYAEQGYEIYEEYIRGAA